MSIDVILLVGAVIAFLLDAFRVSAAVGWTPLGFALVTLSLVV
jgi:hypothetical protein